MTRTEELLALAEAATPSRWIRLFGERTVYSRLEDGCRGVAIVRADVAYSGQDSVNLDFIAAANPETIKQLVELTRLMKRAIRIEHDDHCNCADHILEAIEAFNNFERNL